MVDSDGTEATEVLSLEELRQIAAAEGHETGGLPAAPRKANSEDIAAAEAPSAPKQWNPTGAPAPQPDADQQAGGPQGSQGSAQPGGPQGSQPQGSQPQSGAPHPHQGQWGQEFGAAAAGAASAPNAHVQNDPAQAAPVGPYSGGPVNAPGGPQQPPAGPGYPGPGYQPTGSGGYQQPGYAPAYGAAPAGYGGGPGGPGGPVGPGGPGGPGGPNDPYGRRPETQKVPGWLWVLAVIALVLVVAIVGYIVWDSTQSPDENTAAPSDEPSIGQSDDPEPSPSKSSEPPVAEETFTSPSGNIACTIDSERARCVIKDYDYSPPKKPADCKLDDWGAIVVANKEGSGFSCVEAPETDGPARVLGYGDSISAEGMTCTSSEEGMECKSDDSGIGFNVRRASVDFLK
jgi:hypothetical protein